MILSTVYAVTPRLLSLPVLLLRRDVSKEAELLVLRHQNAILRRQVSRVHYEPADRLGLAALSHLHTPPPSPRARHHRTSDRDLDRPAIRNLVMDLADTGCRARYLIRDRDGKFPALTDEILAEADIQTMLTGVRMPRMNASMERWVQSCRR